MLSERLKRLTALTQDTGGLQEWAGMLGGRPSVSRASSPIRMRCDIRNIFLAGYIGLTYRHMADSSYAATTAPREWEEKIYGVDSDPSPCHRGKGGTIVIRWLACISCTSCPTPLLCTPSSSMGHHPMTDGPRPYFYCLIALSP